MSGSVLARRRPSTVALAALVTVVFLGAGCAGGGSGTATPSRSPSSPTSSPSPSVDPSAKAICDDLQHTILDSDTRAFGAELGKMVAARAAGDTAGQDKARQAAIAKLHEISGKLRTHAGEATDLKLKNALNAAADNLDKLASDTDNFNNIGSLDLVTQTTKRFAEAFNDIAKYCA